MHDLPIFVILCILTVLALFFFLRDIFIIIVTSLVLRRENLEKVFIEVCRQSKEEPTKESLKNYIIYLRQGRRRYAQYSILHGITLVFSAIAYILYFIN